MLFNTNDNESKRLSNRSSSNQNKVKMDLNNGYHLGKDNAGFIVWNNKDIKRLQSKDFKDAVIESKLILKNVNINGK